MIRSSLFKSVLLKQTVFLYKNNFATNYSTMVKAKKVVYAKAFVGEPKLTDFELLVEDLPDIKDGGN